MDEAVDYYGTLGEVGLDHVMLSMSNDTADAAYELVGELVHQLEPVTAGTW